MYTQGNPTNQPPGSQLTRTLFHRAIDAASIIFKSVSLINLTLKSIHLKHWPEVFIISIDNLSFGGTGKTTLVNEIGNHLQNIGTRFAVVTRGYKSRFETTGIKVQPDHGAEDVGDEALLYRTHFPLRDIYVGKNRTASIRQAILDRNPVILLDDGFQTTQVYKDLKIMLYNPQHPYFYLRNFRFLMKKEDIALYYKPSPSDNAASYSYDFEPDGFCTGEGTPVNISRTRTKLVGFSALGDNLRFKESLNDYLLLEFTGFRDHHFYTGEDLAALENRRTALGADYLICTEKDFIKIKHLKLSIPLIYAKNKIKFNFNLMEWIVTKYNAKKKCDF